MLPDQRVREILTQRLRDDLYFNEHEQNREWAMEDVARAYPDYQASPYWPYRHLGDDYDNNVMIESEAKDAIEQVANIILPDLPDIPDEETAEEIIDDAINDFFSNDVWGNYGVKAYYTDTENTIYTLDEFVQYLKTGEKPEYVNREIFTEP